VSQLEHMQLIGSGVDVPDLKKGCVNNCLIRALIEYFIAVVAAKYQRKSWQTRVAQPILRWLPTWYSPSVITCLE
jgi:hypothetical protein